MSFFARVFTGGNAGSNSKASNSKAEDNWKDNENNLLQKRKLLEEKVSETHSTEKNYSTKLFFKPVFRRIFKPSDNPAILTKPKPFLITICSNMFNNPNR